MTTIQDVARRAGVAPITASRVINQSGYFSEQARTRVEAAAAELGYVPNSVARSLRSRRTQTLALVLTDITNPFFTQVARGVEDVASDAGFTVIYCNTDESEEEERKYLNVLQQKQVDGILLVPALHTALSSLSIYLREIPIVALDRRLPGVETDVVRCDSRAGAYHLARLLVEQGHRRIALLGGPAGITTADEREAGFRQALAESGLLDDSLVIHGEFNHTSGFNMTRQALAHVSRPTALMAGNNFIAIGVLKALRDARLAVPAQVSVVGFDDLPEALVVEPFLTVAFQPAYEMGRVATQLLLSRLAGQENGPCREVLLPVEIIRRQSCRPPVA